MGRNSGGVNVSVYIRSRSSLNTTKSVKIAADSREVFKYFIIELGYYTHAPISPAVEKKIKIKRPLKVNFIFYLFIVH